LLFGLLLLGSVAARADDGGAEPVLPNWMCTVGALDADDAPIADDPDLAASELAPTGVLRVGVQYGNPNNANRFATVTLPDGTVARKFAGVAVDLACRLAARLAVPLVFTGDVAGTPGYAGVPQQAAAFARGDFDVGFSQDPLLRRLGPSAHAHLWVEGHFMVPAASPFVQGTLAELDQPGVRISVATANSVDIFLGRNLQNAQLVDTTLTGGPLTVPQAIQLLTSGQVDAFGGSLAAEAPFTASGAFRSLPESFADAHLGMFVHDGLDEGQHYLSVFVEWAKRKGYVADAIAAAGLVGVQVPPPEKVGGVGSGE
jgi:polar amino acid transport system substrate-binding protein